MKILLIIIILTLSCCDYKRMGYTTKSYEITNFNKVIIDSLIPEPNASHVVNFIKVVGFCDDTIKVHFYNEKYDVLLIGNIDTIYRDDYYGYHTIKFKFDPYKARKGKLKIEFALN